MELKKLTIDDMKEMKQIYLCTDRDKPAYNFYLKCGFKELTDNVSFFNNCKYKKITI